MAVVATHFADLRTVARFVAILAAALALLTAPPSYAKRSTTKEMRREGLEDPRLRERPRTHRFRLGLQLDYMRLSAAVAQNGSQQRFHYVPLMIDLAYQAQLFRHLMIRPSFAFGPNTANTWAAMPFIVHPALHAGYQGAYFGAALGYGWFGPIVHAKDAIDPVRGGLGQPVILNNHEITAELSLTTRIDRGALSFIGRIGAVSSRLQHFALDERSWRPIVSFNFGWYFGDGRRAKKRRRGS